MTILQFPENLVVPQHIAIIMDGNRRWAKQRNLPKAIGHANGASKIRQIVKACSARGIKFLTLFAFSTENWKRPPDEVTSLMGLFVYYLQKEVDECHADGVRMKIVGEVSGFDDKLQKLIRHAEEKTKDNSDVTLTLAANYGGRWDMLQATRAWCADHDNKPPANLTEDMLQPYLSMAYAPDPELVIRTGGEHRISNFLLWQMAYSELHFTDALWPEFSVQDLDAAIAWFQQRDRRFGGETLTVTR
jgi:undecaprenyl diphosphate synthase